MPLLLALIPTDISDLFFSPFFLACWRARPKTFNIKYNLIKLSDSFSLYSKLLGV
jgi:hypothetical protein